MQLELDKAVRQSVDPQAVRNRRSIIAERLLRESDSIDKADFQRIERRDLFELFVQYDDQFLDHGLSRHFEQGSDRLGFRLSSRMTSTGGMTTWRALPDYHDYEIAVSTTLLFNTPFDRGATRVGGVVATSRLDALQRIFEHELVHLLEMILWGESSCAQPRFRNMVARMFGHTESNHQLLTPAETARSHFGIRTGDRVRFQHEGQWLTGYVNAINRRATVLVPNAGGELFDDERRYLRFYVPLDLLTTDR
ncbi:MAG: hypothetical protein ACR2NP_22225 [Pirellulaceae bacterium]